MACDQRDTSSSAIRNWYFSPQASLDDIDSLATELQDMQNQFDQVIVTGDLNTHHVSWLRFWNGNTPRGAKLKYVCDMYGLKQMVKQLTRGPYLLDLVLTDPKAVCVELDPKIADHSSLIIHVPECFEERHMGSRSLWHYSDADWASIEKTLERTEVFFPKQIVPKHDIQKCQI